MTKKNRKNKKGNKKRTPISRRYTVYSLPRQHNTTFGIVFLAFFAFGIGVLLEGEYISATIPLLIAATIAYAALTEVQQVDIFKDTMIVDTAISRNVYKASEIVDVEWRMTTYIKRRGGYGSKLLLYIDTTRGKSIRLQPAVKYDIQKSILDWRNKHQHKNIKIYIPPTLAE